jgi:hypothetical protein
MEKAPRALALSAVILASLASPSLCQAAMPEIVARAIEFHGGDLFRASTTSFEVCSKSGCSRVEVTTDGGLYRHDVEAAVKQGRRRVVATNDDVEAWLDGREIEVSSPAEEQRLRDWAMQRIYFNFLPYRLGDPTVRFVDLGLERWEGRELHKVAVAFEPGSSTDADDEFLYWFDPISARLELFAYSYEVGGGGLRFRRLFDFRRVGGLLFYDQENWGVDGEGLSIDLVSPEFVAQSMRRVSTIELRDIEVEPIPR